MTVACVVAVMSATAQSGRGNGATPTGSPAGHDHSHTGAAGNIRQISTAWKPLPPLGLHEAATIDTISLNYYRQAIPSSVSDAYATTGNTASPGYNMIFMERESQGDFYFRDALSHWLPSFGTQKFYNTRIPMTLLSYNFGGGRENGQDRLQAVFSGNATKRWQVGAMLDYIYSKGSYNYQAAKDLTWGVSGSYMGERYEMQAFFYHYNNLGMDNGGITDDLYITDPAELQGGTSSINPKSIPTRLDAARTRLKGTQLWINNRYKVGYWHEEEINDSTVRRTYIPVSSFIHTLNYREGKHRFTNTGIAQGEQFWSNRYLSADGTHDETNYWSLSNTLGVSMLEGFHKLAKFGLAAYATYEIRKYNLMPYKVPDEGSSLTPYPYPSVNIAPSYTENLLYAGAQLTKQRGTILTYEATARLGVVGPVAGDVHADGSINTRIPLFGDCIGVTAFGRFTNQEAPLLMKHYVSNHFIWDNDFGKEQRIRAGGRILVPHTGTRVDVAFENLSNHIYFGPDCLPRQHSGSVQVFSASASQRLHLGILHWDNRVTYQATSDDKVIPLPAFAWYSNLYILFKVAHVLDVQTGIDCDYYTSYKGVSYQPATMAFYNQDEAKVGNYPFMNFYINMKLKKVRFYLMFSHINQGLFSKNYFSMPHYPLNPRKFQLGLSVDFAN